MSRRSAAALFGTCVLALVLWYGFTADDPGRLIYLVLRRLAGAFF